MGDDAAITETFHNSFQDPERFLAAGGPRFQLTQQVMSRFAAIQASGVDVVPRAVVGSSGHNGDAGSPTSGNVMEALLTMLLSERVGGDPGAPNTPRSADVEAVRARIRDGMKGTERYDLNDSARRAPYAGPAA